MISMKAVIHMILSTSFLFFSSFGQVHLEPTTKPAVKFDIGTKDGY